MKPAHPGAPSIALFIQGVRHYERELLRGISDYGKANGPWQFYRSVPYLFEKVADPIELIHKWKPDGIIIRESSPRRYDELLKTKLPAIYSPTTECSKNVPNIVVNDIAAGKRVTGMTLYAYIQDRRLEKFARLLIETDRTVSEIAYALGEHSVTNVARQFQSRYRCTPLTYRR